MEWSHSFSDDKNLKSLLRFEIENSCLRTIHHEKKRYQVKMINKIVYELFSTVKFLDKFSAKLKFSQWIYF